ncbi:hypothetical protein [Nonomuraea sp. LPB2021202275-12-8]|uniref:hypothetical protein n=1 Tax=Nonomuraea sp. LPB2021202275-12-8 TaxID=3120159 RepID=UPI003FA60684
MPQHWRLRRQAATATSRLGLRTSLAAAFGDDDCGDFCWRPLEKQEAVDLSRPAPAENVGDGEVGQAKGHGRPSCRPWFRLLSGQSSHRHVKPSQSHDLGGCKFSAGAMSLLAAAASTLRVSGRAA